MARHQWGASSDAGIGTAAGLELAPLSLKLMLYLLNYAAPARRRTTPDEAPVRNSIPACSSVLRIARACATVIGGSSSTLSARANVSGRSLQARARSFRSQPSKVRAARICEPVITIPNPCPCLMGCDLLAWRRSPPSEVASCRTLQREEIAAPPRAVEQSQPLALTMADIS